MDAVSFRDYQGGPGTPGMNKRKVSQLIISGFLASVAMVFTSYLLRAFGIPAPDYGNLYGAILNAQTYPGVGTGLWWMGLVWHVLNGTLIFSLLFSVLVDRLVLPQSRWLKGALWGTALFLIVEMVVNPLAGVGFFSANEVSPAAMVFCNFLCWMVYGTVLDGMTRARIVHAIEIRKAA